MSNTLLLDEYPLLILPELAVKIGLNEAIVLQQLHYWLVRSKHEFDGRQWVYNSYPKWKEQFPWWGLNTIKRTVSHLETMGFIITGSFNKKAFDKTKWYSIDYDAIAKSVGRPSTQNGSTIDPKRVDDETNTGAPIPETSPETKLTKTIPNDKKNGQRQTLPSPLLGEIHKVEAKLLELRGYPSPVFAGERKAIKWMLENNYDAGGIGACYIDQKKDVFWKDKELTMMTIQKQIGAWRARLQPVGPEKYFAGKYAHVMRR